MIFLKITYLSYVILGKNEQFINIFKNLSMYVIVNVVIVLEFFLFFIKLFYLFALCTE